EPPADGEVVQRLIAAEVGVTEEAGRIHASEYRCAQEMIRPDLRTQVVQQVPTLPTRRRRARERDVRDLRTRRQNATQRRPDGRRIVIDRAMRLGLRFDRVTLRRRKDPLDVTLLRELDDIRTLLAQRPLQPQQRLARLAART